MRGRLADAPGSTIASRRLCPRIQLVRGYRWQRVGVGRLEAEQFPHALPDVAVRAQPGAVGVWARAVVMAWVGSERSMVAAPHAQRSGGAGARVPGARRQAPGCGGCSCCQLLDRAEPRWACQCRPPSSVRMSRRRARERRQSAVLRSRTTHLSRAARRGGLRGWPSSRGTVEEPARNPRGGTRAKASHTTPDRGTADSAAQARMSWTTRHQRHARHTMVCAVTAVAASVQTCTACKPPGNRPASTWSSVCRGQPAGD